MTQMTCPECSKPFTPRGLARHRTVAHGVKVERRPARVRPTADELEIRTHLAINNGDKDAVRRALQKAEAMFPGPEYPALYAALDRA